jgi:hypothetical protein
LQAANTYILSARRWRGVVTGGHESKSFVGGGYGSSASGEESFVGGGIYNTASRRSAFIGGGFDNTASGRQAFIGGGFRNSTIGDRSFIGGSSDVTANDLCAFLANVNIVPCT